MSQLIQDDWNWSMQTWKIRRPEEGALNDPIIAEVAEVEYHGEYMGESYLSVTINSEVPIDLRINDYIVYRGERFFLSVVPACKQQATKGSSGNAFVYENVKFNSLANELATCDFLDVVLSDNNIHWTALPTFSFYCENVKALADRIQANLDRVYGENTWIVEVGNYNAFDEEITIDKQTVWDALSIVDTTFHTNFIIRGRHIYIGTDGTSVDHVFKCGVGNGLVSLERTIDDSQKVVTRLRAYGNTTNMPTNYYFYRSVMAFLEIKREKVQHNSVMVNEISCYQSKKYLENYDKPCYITFIRTFANRNVCIFADKRELFFNNVGDKSLIVDRSDNPYVFKWYIDDVGSHPYITIHYNEDEDSGEFDEVRCYVYSSGFDFYFEVVEFGEEKPAFYSWFEEEYKKDAFFNENSDVWFFVRNKDINFEIDGDNVAFENIKSSNPELLDYGYYPNNMAVTRLMLPGFPTKESFKKDLGYLGERYNGYKLVGDKHDIYIESPNISKLGAVEGSLYVDGTDNEYTKKDIYPSIEGITATDLRNAGFIINIKDANVNENLDEISVSGNIPINPEKVYLDSGNKDYEECDAECYVYLKDIGFDINNCMLSGQTPMLHMKSGKCAGREFEIVRCVYLETTKADRYKLTIKRQKDDTLNILFPNRDQEIKSGDKFVLLNIKPPSVYYETAKQRLLRESLKWFVNNDSTRFAFTPTIDNLWMARERRKKKAEGKEEESIYNAIQAGDLMMIESDDLGIGTSVRISSLTIKENSQSPIPEFDVQLQDKKSVGAIQRIQNKLEDYTNSGGGGLSYDQVKTVISDSGSYKFISKRDDDFAEGQITMEKGVIAQSSHDGKETAADGLIEYYTEEES